MIEKNVFTGRALKPVFPGHPLNHNLIACGVDNICVSRTLPGEPICNIKLGKEHLFFLLH